VGARELKTRLGTYLGHVRRGATIVVTERSRPVAELRPIPPGPGVKGRLDELVALGVLSRPSRRPLGPFRPIRVTGPSLARTIVEERGDRF
jgi:prevent-host-death family protein